MGPKELHYSGKSTGTIFKLNQDIIGTYVLSMKSAPNPVAAILEYKCDSRVLTRKTAPSPLQRYIIWTIDLTNFELDQDIIRTNLWTKFHEDQTINVASRVFTSQTVDDARRATDDARHTTDKR
ncbi:hypothetical protein DPMN_048899 [Dreissena polymorpha]|uniref:Uncharacterized protein n=1 Tax=Dreissena polymorpha TaxID=45954 RepID=A0A9D4I2T4_DREPO|nr:hypothetical protein DPMN_048899 [Dreissena polymorpha]